MAEEQQLRDTVAALRQIVAQTATEYSPALLSQRIALLDPAVNYNYSEMRRQLAEAEAQLARLEAAREQQQQCADDSERSKELERLRERCAALEAENRELRKQQSEGTVYLLRAACEAQQAQIKALKAACLQANECVEKLQLQCQRLIQEGHTGGDEKQ